MSRSPSTARERFVEDELARVRTTADQVVDGTLAALPSAVAGAARQQRGTIGDLMQALQANRARFVARFAESVADQVRAPEGTRTGVGLNLGGGLAGGSWSSLSLMDEQEVASDVEVARAVEAIEATAENELRDLNAYCAALVGDMDVAGDHNPFRPETYANALWAAANDLPLARGFQVLLMHHAAQPLAEVLRRAYSRATDQLASAGVQPASYRTVVRHRGPAVGADEADAWDGPPPNLVQIRGAMPASTRGLDARAEAAADRSGLVKVLDEVARRLRTLPADIGTTMHAELMGAQRHELVDAATTRADRQTIELLGRLFEAMLSDHRVPRDVRAVLGRMQPPALRLVLDEERVLEQPEHPMWRFMDLTAHLAVLYPEGHAQRRNLLAHADSLIDGIAAQSTPSAESLQQAVLQIVRSDAERLAQRTAKLRIDIATLQALEDRLNGGADATLASGPLDAHHIDTVPADFLDAPRSPRGDVPDPAVWLSSLHPGDWVRVCIRGHWVRAQLVWVGQHGDTHLFGREQTEGTLALRRRALDRLLQERLLTPLRVRSLLRSAAITVARQASNASNAARVAPPASPAHGRPAKAA